MEVVNIDANGKIIPDLSKANIPQEVFNLINQTILDSVQEAKKCVNKD